MSTTAIPVSGISPPGFSAPAAGFDQPFEMLAACHERVERTLRLLQKLAGHVAKNGCDEPARSAATDVLRYFDQAAPKHHDDEALHVFPLLLAQGDAVLSAHVFRMQADHERMATLWQALRPLLEAVTDPQSTRVDVDTLGRRAMAFHDVYVSHMETEERILFPAAQRLKSADEIGRMGDDMRARRTAT
jgi:hemerythrin-like domain-containing protein